MRTAAALLALALALPAAGAQPRRASLQLVTASPRIVVIGAGFGARERVALRLRAPGAVASLRVRATGRGSFRARFGNARVGRCDGFAVEATGDRGSRALLEVAPGCRESA